MLHIDFETYSDRNIKECGAFRYAEDPSTQALILAYCLGRNDPIVGVELPLDGGPLPEALFPLFDAIDRGAKVCAHNVQFERLIWTKVCKYFPVTPSEDQWDCTAARARMLALPGSLDGAAGALGLPVRKDDRGQGLINIFSKPQKDGRRILPKDRPEDFRAFIDYCIQDVEVERQLDRILPPLSDVEADAFRLDYRINDRGLPVDLEAVHKASAFVETYSEELTKKAVKIAGCRPTQREKTLEFLASRGYKLPDLQAPTVEALAETPGLPGDLVQLLDARIELSRAGTKKFKSIMATVSSDNRIRGSFLFSAASTRRWSSTGVQVHNLQKPHGETNPDAVFKILDSDHPETLVDLFDRPLTALAQSIRGFFRSSSCFYIADYASVEPRGLAWVAGEEWMLRAYRNKEDLYRITAGKVYNLDPKSLSKDGIERFMGKQLVLGCGYGMGPPRFVDTVAKFGQRITLGDSQKAVYGYRESVPNIVKLWKTVEQACIVAVRDWKTVRVGKLRFRPVSLSNGFKVLYVDMPSGTIAYPRPRIGRETWNGMERSTFNFWTPLGSHWVETDTFGGSLVENIIQALTRDILRDGLLAADRAGHFVVGHVHDEGLAEGPPNKADLEDFQWHLSNSSPWAEGFPIETEAFLSERYKK